MKNDIIESVLFLEIYGFIGIELLFILFALTFFGIWSLNYINRMPKNKLNSDLKKKIKSAVLVITFISFLCAFFTIVTMIP